MARQSILLTSVLLVACGRQTPGPPSNQSPAEVVSANNRLAWDQMAADAVELSTIRYAIYVDGTRAELTGVSCATEPANGTFTCSTRLPPMSVGRHQLQLASFVAEGEDVLESSRSSPLEITFVSGITAPAGGRVDGPVSGASTTSKSAALATIADGLDGVSDLAFAPDGRLFVAERSGRVRVVRNGRLLAAPALEIRRRPEIDEIRVVPRNLEIGARDTAAAGALLALAFDPQFDRTHFVYALYTAASRRAALSFVVARYREAGDTLADRVILLDDIPAASPDPAGALRIGPDGKLYVAFDDSGDARLAGDFASPNGKVLRLNTDGSTPDDQAGASPLYSSAYRSPAGLGWDTQSGLLWAVDRAGAGRAQLSAVASTAINGRKRGVTKATLPLPEPFEPSGLVFFQDSLLMASVRGEPLLRSRVDPHERTRIMNTEPLLESMAGGVQALTIGLDGALYFATARAIRRLTLP
jgi:aldose sugar dehydrogenase